MAANVNVTVEGTLVNGAGAAVGSATVKAIRQDPSRLTATTLSNDDTIEATSNASTGVFSLTLVGYDIMPVTYKIVFPDNQYAYITLPPNAKSTGLGKVQISTSPANSVKNISSQFANIKFQGQDLASAAALPQPTCDFHDVTGTTNITSVTDTNFPIGKVLVLTFAGVLTFTDGNNLDLDGNMTTSAGDNIVLMYDGTNFVEISRTDVT